VAADAGINPRTAGIPTKLELELELGSCDSHPLEGLDCNKKTTTTTTTTTTTKLHD
jgi:hypothetical protein